MTVEIAALGLREEAGHWGPIISHAAEVRSASKELLLAVERIVDAPTTRRVSPDAYRTYHGLSAKMQTAARGRLFAGEFDHREEAHPSLAGLAATYSSKP